MTQLKTVGLLALQGDYDLHRQAVEAAGHRTVEVRTVAQLADCDCLIMPGGETTTMRLLMEAEGLFDPIREFGQTHPIMGTCAGLILLSNETSGREGDRTLGLLDCATVRNAYGRQYFSFRQEGVVSLGAGAMPYEMVFIRAPKISRVGPEVDILGTLDGQPTLIRQKNILAMTFHPELAGDNAVHNFFLTAL